MPLASLSTARCEHRRRIWRRGARGGLLIGVKGAPCWDRGLWPGWAGLCLMRRRPRRYFNKQGDVFKNEPCNCLHPCPQDLLSDCVTTCTSHPYSLCIWMVRTFAFFSIDLSFCSNSCQFPETFLGLGTAGGSREKVKSRGLEMHGAESLSLLTIRSLHRINLLPSRVEIDIE